MLASQKKKSPHILYLMRHFNANNYLLEAKMDKVVFAMTLLLSVTLFAQQSFSKSNESYHYLLKEGSKEFQEQLDVKNEGNRKTLTWRDKNNLRQVVKLTGDKVDEIVYFNHQNEVLVKVNYDYPKGKVFVKGKKDDMDLSISDRVYESKAFFFMFKYWKPTNNKEKEFTLLVSDDYQSVGMTLKYVGEETIKLNGEEFKTQKYEMGLSSSVKSLFWPYKYYYWYDEELEVVVKYQGVDENKKLILQELVKYKT